MPGKLSNRRTAAITGRPRLLLGALTARMLLEKLLPGLNVVTRPRMSVLSYAGEKKLTRLPPRSAVVAFSAGEVYAIAELIRRMRGGAAIVMGALSRSGLKGLFLGNTAEDVLDRLHCDVVIVKPAGFQGILPP